MIVPVYQSAGQAVLWDDPNPWREAWEHAPAVSGRAVVPLGDAGDLAAIDAEKARAGDTDAIAAVARSQRRRRGARRARCLQGSPDRPSGLDVRLHRYRDGRLVDTRSEGFSANPGESTADLLRRAVAAIAPDIGVGREPEPPSWPLGSRSKRLTAVLPIDSLDDWLRARERLQARAGDPQGYAGGLVAPGGDDCHRLHRDDRTTEIGARQNQPES